jgi:aryl-alcohol dehydrogenase-like predicted oxidoreductase
MARSSYIQAHEVNMEFVDIPGTQLRVSRVALGTWAMGGWMWGGTDERESVQTIWAALDQGINLIDTAPAYGSGVSEEIVGKAWRPQVCARVRHCHQGRPGNARRQGVSQCDPERICGKSMTPCAACAPTTSTSTRFTGPIRSCPSRKPPRPCARSTILGKIRAIGVSNFSVEQMERFRQVAPLHVLQPPYNLFERAIEAQILPYCRANNIATFGYGALCRGLLSGRMQADTTFAGDDLRGTDPKFQPPRFAQYLAAVRQLDQLARDRFHRRVIQLAVRWMLDQGISVALWGGRHPDQLEPALGVAGWKLDAASLRRINQILSTTITDPVGPEFMAPQQRPDFVEPRS